MSEEGPRGGTIDPGTAARARTSAWALPAAAVVVSTLVLLGPVLRGGYLLRYDMVFAPRMPLGAAQFGLGSQLPRNVPSDALAAVLTRVLPGAAVQDLLLAALLLAAGFGAARLTAPAAVPRTAAALAYVWTPYLGERLLLGQWAVLVGWAVLPWVVEAARQLRFAPPGIRRRAWARLAFATGVQCLGGVSAWTLALLVLPVALAWDGGITARRRAARVGAGLVLLAVYALPWALPGLLREGGVGADPAGAVAFAPAPDIPFGTVVSLFTGGGIWNADAVPPGRDSVVAALGALLLAAVALAGAWHSRRDSVIASLSISAVVGLGVAVATAWPAGARAFGALPFGAVLRDSQRLLVPWLLLIALGLAAGTDELSRRAPGSLRGAVALLAVLPVAVLPALGWGVAGRLTTVDYPADFARVRAVVAADRIPGAVLVVPFSTYRRFPWNGGRVVLDPLGQWLERPVLAASDLPVRVGSTTLVVHGEDRLAARVDAALAAASPGSMSHALGRLGVRWVVADAPLGRRLRSDLRAGAGGPPIGYRGRDLIAYRIPVDELDRHAAVDVYRGYGPPVGPVIAGDILAALVLVGSGLCTAPVVRRPRLRSAC